MPLAWHGLRVIASQPGLAPRLMTARSSWHGGVSLAISRIATLVVILAGDALVAISAAREWPERGRILLVMLKPPPAGIDNALPVGLLTSRKGNPFIEQVVLTLVSERLPIVVGYARLAPFHSQGSLSIQPSLTSPRSRLATDRRGKR